MNDQSRIHVLPDLLVRKIAAGEVIERPASVLKELLENAVDAGATRITVTVEEGGKQLIRVTDDGGGMSPQELQLAVRPHATSKITIEDDLYLIATMGFRGEALASISSVAKLRIVSRLPDSIEGHEIRVAADQVESSQAAGCPAGTTVEVRDLFFNVPVRRKFLRANSTETGHVHEQFTRIAMANRSISFELTSNGRRKYNLPQCNTYLERIARFYSPELAAALLPIRRNERGVELEVYAAPPAQARATAQWQYTFVNGRHIRDRYIQHAIKEAYRGLMEPNRHGVVFLFLTLDPRNIDVNVHPSKIEVRWADSNLIHSQVLSALRETFQRADLVPALRTDRSREPVDEARQDRVRSEMAALLKTTAPILPGSGPQSPTGAGRSGSRPLPQGGFGPPVDPEQVWRSLYSPPESPTQAPGTGEDSTKPPAPAQPAPSDPGTSGPPTGSVRVRPRAVQMHNLYLVAETDDGIVIADQHALHERILYEQFRERITVGPLQSQRLLLPETLNVTSAQAALLETQADLLARLGIEVTPFGSDAIAVQSFPALLKDADVVGFMRDLLDYLASQAADTSADVVINGLLSMMACKAAVKAGDSLAPEEIDSLFARSDLLENSSSCPHGRPTMLRLTRADLDRQFHRT